MGDTFLRVDRLHNALSAKSKSWNFYIEPNRELLKTFEKEGRKNKFHGAMSEVLRNKKVRKQRNLSRESHKRDLRWYIWNKVRSRRGKGWDYTLYCEMNRSGDQIRGGRATIQRLQNWTLDVGPVHAGEVESEVARGEKLPHEMSCVCPSQWRQPDFCSSLWSAFIY